ncbi:unnamed protein product [Prorocentrum cordatum]|uniref:MIF4G domain-containing protein n=1 Tax=Prorocentrum cordatum TaxID=2364126 RepID=A0ABN9V8P4_9DINO|nr:unnamed protein product [Polarella glacialis]
MDPRESVEACEEQSALPHDERSRAATLQPLAEAERAVAAEGAGDAGERRGEEQASLGGIARTGAALGAPAGAAGGARRERCAPLAEFGEPRRESMKGAAVSRTTALAQHQLRRRLEQRPGRRPRSRGAGAAAAGGPEAPQPAAAPQPPGAATSAPEPACAGARPAEAEAAAASPPEAAAPPASKEAEQHEAAPALPGGPQGAPPAPAPSAENFPTLGGSRPGSAAKAKAAAAPWGARRGPLPQKSADDAAPAAGGAVAASDGPEPPQTAVAPPRPVAAPSVLEPAPVEAGGAEAEVAADATSTAKAAAPKCADGFPTLGATRPGAAAKPKAVAAPWGARRDLVYEKREKDTPAATNVAVASAGPEPPQPPVAQPQPVTVPAVPEPESTETGCAEDGASADTVSSHRPAAPNVTEKSEFPELGGFPSLGSTTSKQAAPSQAARKTWGAAAKASVKAAASPATTSSKAPPPMPAATEAAPEVAEPPATAQPPAAAPELPDRGTAATERRAPAGAEAAAEREAAAAEAAAAAAVPVALPGRGAAEGEEAAPEAAAEVPAARGAWAKPLGLARDPAQARPAAEEQPEAAPPQPPAGAGAPEAAAAAPPRQRQQQPEEAAPAGGSVEAEQEAPQRLRNDCAQAQPEAVAEAPAEKEEEAAEEEGGGATASEAEERPGAEQPAAGPEAHRGGCAESASPVDLSGPPLAATARALPKRVPAAMGKWAKPLAAAGEGDSAEAQCAAPDVASPKAAAAPPAGASQGGVAAAPAVAGAAEPDSAEPVAEAVDVARVLPRRAPKSSAVDGKGRGKAVGSTAGQASIPVPRPQAAAPEAVPPEAAVAACTTAASAPDFVTEAGPPLGATVGAVQKGNAATRPDEPRKLQGAWAKQGAWGKKPLPSEPGTLKVSAAEQSAVASEPSPVPAPADTAPVDQAATPGPAAAAQDENEEGTGDIDEATSTAAEEERRKQDAETAVPAAPAALPAAQPDQARSASVPQPTATSAGAAKEVEKAVSPAAPKAPAPRPTAAPQQTQAVSAPQLASTRAAAPPPQTSQAKSAVSAEEAEQILSNAFADAPALSATKPAAKRAMGVWGKKLERCPGENADTADSSEQQRGSRVVRVEATPEPHDDGNEASLARVLPAPSPADSDAATEPQPSSAPCSDHHPSAQGGIEDRETADSSGTGLERDAEHTDEEDRSDEADSCFGSVATPEPAPERGVREGGAAEAAGATAEPRPALGAVSLRPQVCPKGSKPSLLGGTGAGAPRLGRPSMGVAEMLRWREAALEMPPPDFLHCVALVHETTFEPPVRAPSDRVSRQGSNRGLPQRTPKGGARRQFAREDEPVEPLPQSSSSWAAQQRSWHKDGQDEDNSDTVITRRVRSLLNKLTVEKFSLLLEQLLSCGICTQAHLEILMHEIMEKATTQHHFINMYTELCVHLHRWSEENGIGDASGDKNAGFKKILLNECQNSFEKYLKRPAHLADLTGEERDLAEVRYKTAMIGNIRFVGALLSRQMVASTVIFAIADELLATPPVPDALESLAAFLTTVGSLFDTPNWKHRDKLNECFKKIGKLSKDPVVPVRIRCLLSDVLDLREANWKDNKMATKTIQGPMTIDEVKRAAIEEVGGSQGSGSRAPRASGNGTWSAPATPAGGQGGGGRPRPALQGAGGGEWSTVGGGPRWSPSGRERGKLSQKTSSPPPRPAEAAVKEGRPRRTPERVPLRLRQPPGKHAEAERPGGPDFGEVRAELRATVRELSLSHDISEALQRVTELKVPREHQSAGLDHMLGQIAEEGSCEARAACLTFVVRLFSDGVLLKSELAPGLQKFFGSRVQDLTSDVPSLPAMVRTEYMPAVEELVQLGCLGPEQKAACAAALGEA